VRLLAGPEEVTDPEGALLGALEALTGGEDPGQGPCVPGLDEVR
jgi:hypothetical protein